MNYLLPNSEKTLFITSESGFENVKIYHEGSFIGKVESPAQLADGFEIHDSPVGIIQLRVPAGKSILEVRVNDFLCTPQVAPEDIEDLKSFDKFFWGIAILGVVGTLIQAYTLRAFLELSWVKIELGLSILAVTIYFVAAVLTRKGKAWGFLLGTIMFTLMSLYYLLAVYLQGWPIVGVLISLVRFVIIALLFYKMQAVFVHFKKDNQTSKHTLLDDF